jgi:hypothetical protein
MRKDKSGKRFGKNNERFRPRSFAKFQIGPNSHPSKVARWLGRGGGVPLTRTPEQIAAAHIHPRSLRAGSR